MPSLILNRQQLAQFLPTQEAIKAFEALFKLANATTPESIEEVSALLGSGKGVNLDPLIKRLEDLEQLIQRKQNLTAIEKRVEELEMLINRKDNVSSLLDRIEKIENYLGV